MTTRRLDNTDLDNLEAAAHGRTGVGVLAHPVDVLRLVAEVRWYKAWMDAITRATGYDPRVPMQVDDADRNELRRRETEVKNAITDAAVLVDGEAGRDNVRVMWRDAYVVNAVKMMERQTSDAAQIIGVLVYVMWKERQEQLKSEIQKLRESPAFTFIPDDGKGTNAAIVDALKRGEVLRGPSIPIPLYHTDPKIVGASAATSGSDEPIIVNKERKVPDVPKVFTTGAPDRLNNESK